MEPTQDCSPDPEALGAPNVTVTRIDTGSGWDWEWDVNGKKKADVDVPLGKKTDITFLLMDGGKDLRFDASGPFFYGPVGECPTGFKTGSEFMVLSCDAKKLVVQDFNVNPGDFQYQLNFVDAGGNSVKPLDPIIRNGGGGPTPFGR